MINLGRSILVVRGGRERFVLCKPGPRLCAPLLETTMQSSDPGVPGVKIHVYHTKSRKIQLGVSKNRPAPPDPAGGPVSRLSISGAIRFFLLKKNRIGEIL